MEDDDIPVLKDVHSKPSGMALTAEHKAALIAEMTPILRSQLAAEMRDEIQAFIRSETLAMASSHATLQPDAQTFAADVQTIINSEIATYVDKLKADLSTDVPKMLHQNLQLVEADMHTHWLEKLDSLQSEGIAATQAQLQMAMATMQSTTLNSAQQALNDVEAAVVMQASQILREKMVAMDADLFKAYQAKTHASLEQVNTELTQQTQAELQVFLNALQLQAQQELAQKLQNSFPALYQQFSDELMGDMRNQLNLLAAATKTEFTEALNVELPAIETVLATKVDAVLAEEIPKIQALLIEAMHTEFKALIANVRLSV